MITNKKTGVKIKEYILIVCVLLFFLLLGYLINSFYFIAGTDIKNIQIGYMLENNIQSKSLELPVPFTLTNNSFITFDNRANFQKNLYNYIFNNSLSDYYEILNNNYYYYDINNYDCKYWAYVNTLYYKMNYKKHNWSMDYITTDNHIFIIIYNNSGYCVLESNNYKCWGEMI